MPGCSSQARPRARTSALFPAQRKILCLLPRLQKLLLCIAIAGHIRFAPYRISYRIPLQGRPRGSPVQWLRRTGRMGRIFVRATLAVALSGRVVPKKEQYGHPLHYPREQVVFALDIGADTRGGELEVFVGAPLARDLLRKLRQRIVGVDLRAVHRPGAIFRLKVGFDVEPDTDKLVGHAELLGVEVAEKSLVVRSLHPLANLPGEAA